MKNNLCLCINYIAYQIMEILLLFTEIANLINSLHDAPDSLEMKAKWEIKGAF